MKKTTKLMEKMEAYFRGEFQLEDLSPRELKELERRVFKAVAKKFEQKIAPSTRSLH